MGQTCGESSRLGAARTFRCWSHTMSNLLPCPFCAHSRPVVAHRSWQFDRVQFFGGQVGCRACGAEMFCGHGEQEHRLTEAAEGCAVAAWNLRAAPRSDEAVARALFKARGYDGEFFAGGPAS